MEALIPVHEVCSVLQEYETNGGIITTDDYTCITNRMRIRSLSTFEFVSDFLSVAKQTYRHRRVVANRGGAMLEMHRDEKYDLDTLIVVRRKFDMYQWSKALEWRHVKHQCLERATDQLQKDVSVVIVTMKMEHLMQLGILCYRTVCPHPFVETAINSYKSVFTYIVDDIDHDGATEPCHTFHFKHPYYAPIVEYYRYDAIHLNDVLDSLPVPKHQTTLVFNHSMNPRKLFNKYYLDIQKGKNLGRFIYVEWPLRMMITKKFIQHVVFLGAFDPKEAQLALKYMTCSHHVNIYVLHRNDDEKTMYEKLFE